MIWRRLTHVPARLRRVWREAITDADHHYDLYLRWREHLAQLGMADVRGREVLDIGTGDRAPMSLLFATAGARVTSLDTLPIEFGWRRPLMWWRVAKTEGSRRAIVAATRDVLHTFRYWRHLKTRAGQSLPFSDITLVRGDAAHLPNRDSSFDLVVSSAVWEHLPDVAGATREVDRVLRPNGIAAILIALFPGIRGGHHAEWHTANPGTHREIRPWDHLYPNRVPLPLYLNGWRESQYRTVLGSSLAVIEWEDGEMEGRDYLTERVSRELSEFSERDLLLSWITVWATRRDPNAVNALDDYDAPGIRLRSEGSIP